MKLSNTEWTVMNAVWESAEAVSARDVLERVEDETDWAYTTVKTILTRLVDKGVLSEHKRANTNYYEPLVSRDLARRDALRSLMDNAFDGQLDSLLQHMVSREKLSRRDRQRLAELLAEFDQLKRKKK